MGRLNAGDLRADTAVRRPRRGDDVPGRQLVVGRRAGARGTERWLEQVRRARPPDLCRRGDRSRAFPGIRRRACAATTTSMRSGGERVYENRYVIWGQLKWGRLKRYEVYEDTQKTAKLRRLAGRQQACARGRRLMPAVEVSAGTIEYADTGGDGPPLVLLHGLAMDGAVWRDVVSTLGGGYALRDADAPVRRAPTADASRRRPVAARDRTDRGRAAGRARPRDVTLCFNDWGGAQVMIADGLMERVGRLALIACEAFENYPPGIPGRLAAISARMPGGIAMMRRSLMVRTLRELPFTFGRMSKRGVPDDADARVARPDGQRGDPPRPRQVRRRLAPRPPRHAGRDGCAGGRLTGRCWWSGPAKTS